MPVDFPTLHDSDLDDLREQARALKLANTESMSHGDLVFAVGQELASRDNLIIGRGVLEVHDNFLPGQEDIDVSQSQIRRFKLQTGDTVIGVVRPPKEGERYTALLRVESVNGEPPGGDPPSFETLTAIYPDDRLPLHQEPILRAVDLCATAGVETRLAAPMGLGQRGILVAPARTGRVDLLHQLAALLGKDPDLTVTVLLVGERPEEIHEWRKQGTAEIVATPFDEPPARHVQVADIVFERARRMVERGDDAVLLVDSLSRLLRFCLAELPPSGRAVGGIDTAALHRIRRYLGAARALEEGGSLTVIGVVSGDAENDMDKVLLDDLRDVVNWELTLNRDLADRGIRPPVDVHRSGTRREERLLDAEEVERRRKWRASLTGDVVEDGESLIAAASNGMKDAAPARRPSRTKAKAAPKD